MKEGVFQLPKSRDSRFDPNFLLGLYFVAIGQRELAEHYHNLLQQLAPDFPLTRRLHKQLFPGLVRRLWQRVTGRT